MCQIWAVPWQIGYKTRAPVGQDKNTLYSKRFHDLSFNERTLDDNTRPPPTPVSYAPEQYRMGGGGVGLGHRLEYIYFCILSVKGYVDLQIAKWFPVISIHSY